LLIFQVVNTRTRIENHNKTSSMNAQKGCFNVKNNKLHNILKIKLTPKTATNFGFCFFFEFVHEKYNEIAIKMNKVVQTIGKTKFGGVILGLIDLYH